MSYHMRLGLSHSFLCDSQLTNISICIVWVTVHLTCPASCLSFSRVQVPMQYLNSQSDVALWDKLPESSILFWIFVLLQSSFVRHLPNQTIIKWSPTVAPISKIWEREREREFVSWEMGERDRAGGSLWIWVCG